MVHALDVPVGPGMVRFGQAVLDAVALARSLERTAAQYRCRTIAVLGQVRELDNTMPATFHVGHTMRPIMIPVGVPDRLGDGIAAAGVSGLWVTQDEIGKMPDLRGAYVLVLRLDKTINIKFPRIAFDQLMPGWYVYLGSARGSGGIRARVKRHFQYRKTAHWHIDRLTEKSVEMAALAVADGHECELVGKLLKSLRFKVAVAGFGNTDCHLCESHLLAASVW